MYTYFWLLSESCQKFDSCQNLVRVCTFTRVHSRAGVAKLPSFFNYFRQCICCCVFVCLYCSCTQYSWSSAFRDRTFLCSSVSWSQQCNLNYCLELCQHLILHANVVSHLKKKMLKGLRPVPGFVIPMHGGACETGSQIPRSLARGIWCTVRTNLSALGQQTPTDDIFNFTP